MPIYSCQFTIWPTSNVQADATINTWWCEAGSSADALLFSSAVSDFYRSLSTYYPNTVRQNGHTVKIYDWSDPEPRVPRQTATFNFTSVPSGISLPPEVAKCLSFQGVAASGVPQARRRGRIYLGPFNTGSQQSTGGDAGRPSGTFTTAMANAADTLLTASKVSSTWFWIVYSRVSNSGVEVENGWVDNEWDTQRSRGRPATSRTVFS